MSGMSMTRLRSTKGTSRERSKLGVRMQTGSAHVGLVNG